MKKYQDSAYLYSQSAAYLETLYETYLQNPTEVEASWHPYFKTILGEKASHTEPQHSAIRQRFLDLASAPPCVENSDYSYKQARVLKYINAYRAHGHHCAQLDPLDLSLRQTPEDLTLAFHHLSEQDNNTEFDVGSFYSEGKQKITLKKLSETLKKVYCGTIGLEFMHIASIEQTQWLQSKMEARLQNFSAEQKKRILYKLTAAEGLEHYLGKRYVGQKRFSLEGGESLIPLLDEFVQRAGTQGVKEAIIGMAHRGRLNVLVNVLGKSPNDLFQEFEGKYWDEIRSGDVKYHLGYSSNLQTEGEPIHLALAFNPSHLEIVSPVVIGSVRARQDRRDDDNKSMVIPLIIHGDAAFAGQGVVMETFNMSQARGFNVGGTIHLIINNQIGFTTSNPLDARSTLYCTDVAKMVQAPILHVNGDDPEAVVYAMQVALDFRMTFHKDIVIDLVCYRRHGHNEADDPFITQPLMYEKIRHKKSTLATYAEACIQQQVVSADEVTKMVSDYRQALDEGHPVLEVISKDPCSKEMSWAPYLGKSWTEPAVTHLSEAHIAELTTKFCHLPSGFTLPKQVEREINNRLKMGTGELPMNWGFGETLAYASLLTAGYRIRLCGQDACRGTFSHRHAVLHNQKTGEIYTPLQHLSDDQAPFTVIDSVLSEEAVLGFEYGYATANARSLVIWEAQFGDFANGAQVVIDQFIASGDQKWGRLCGLVLLLPHGYEGMGPEHSSARLERFLQLCAQYNMQVCVPSTPAQCFHMLRRQMLRPYRKPLIVMSPKSLLRHKLAVSSLTDLTQGTFELVMSEVDELPKKTVKRIVICSGKVYYDLLEKRRTDSLKEVAILRIEQLYPFPEVSLQEQLKQYPNVQTIVWCQEEPKNQGAWYSIQHHLQGCITHDQTLHYAGREPSAAPAVGYAALHAEQQKSLVENALGIA